MNQQRSSPVARPPNVCACTESADERDAPSWIELRVTEIDALVMIGLLKVETRNDLNAIREALYEYLDQTLGRAA